MNGLHVIKYPSGRFGFVGKVPQGLAFEYESDVDLFNARHCGPRIAENIAHREGRKFGQRTWPSEQDARDAAKLLGYEVNN